ncbi:hypothetical protein LCR_05245 [Aeromonas enteropelogenes]|uniref:Uncharacterized protein n=1 Tax=Aeromonas enteropelogenes TaxID=29489 RepID=A0A175VD10_AEREN|nr:hypothetical protein LCR_05245 [Aeromonas enteropelogenes]
MRTKTGGCLVVKSLLRNFVIKAGYFLVILWKKKMANGIFHQAILITAGSARQKAGRGYLI